MILFYNSLQELKFLLTAPIKTSVTNIILPQLYLYCIMLFIYVYIENNILKKIIYIFKNIFQILTAFGS